jgi:hypothetical protein
MFCAQHDGDFFYCQIISTHLLPNKNVLFVSLSNLFWGIFCLKFLFLLSVKILFQHFVTNMVYLYFNIILFQYFCGQYNQVFIFQFCDIKNLPKKNPKE